MGSLSLLSSVKQLELCCIRIIFWIGDSMSARENTEDVLRRIHILFSKAEPYQTSTRRVVVDKVELMDLLKQLNTCIYDMMEEYEMTQQSHDRAERDMKKKAEDIVFDARKDADDIYAASIMYTDRALKNIQDSMDDTVSNLEHLLLQMKTQIEHQKNEVHDNQLDLRARLQDMVDSDKYFRLIQDENLRLQKEKEAQEAQSRNASKMKNGSLDAADSKNASSEDSDNPYKDIVPEIHINPAYDPAQRAAQAEAEAKPVESKEEEIASVDYGDDMPDLSPEEMADLDRLQDELNAEKGEGPAGSAAFDTGDKKASGKKPFGFSGLFGKK